MGRARKESKDYHDVERMKSVSENYKHCEVILKKRFQICDSDKSQLQIYQDYIQEVNTTLLNMDPVFREIIEREFFVNGDPTWWYHSFSKTSFYRYRKLAIDIFLRAFYEG